MDKPQKEPSNLGRNKDKLDLPAPRPKQQVSASLGFVFILILFSVFIGYQIYGSLTENSARWEPDHFASQQNNRLLEKQRETFKAEIERENKIEEVGSVEKNALEEQDKAEMNPNAAALLTIGEPIKEKRNKEDSLKSDLTDIQPAGFVADQKSIIYFKHNSNTLPKKAYETLNNVIKFTAQQPNLKISVEGFTDSHGDPVYNKQLSKYRADIVKSYLIGQGISGSRINAVGRGSENPLKSNQSSEGREKNRRVEIKFGSQ